MEKIISLFQRNYETDHLVRDEVVPGAEWVPAGEGVATYKWDGTSCLVRGGAIFKRYDAKPGRTPPTGFEKSGEPDPVTGRVQGWVPVGDGPEDRWHREAFIADPGLPDGTYELIGPKVQGNPYRLDNHKLVRHGGVEMPAFPRSFEQIRSALERMLYTEGVVWHHPDGRMVKIKRKDFGFPWPHQERN
jgi:hypothetical protein